MVDGEDIHEAASRYATPRSAPLEDWYPAAVSSLPLFQGRLICQRANCWWDSKLRRRYAVWILAASATVALFVVILGVIQELSLEEFVLAVAAPLTPTLLWAIREVSRQRETAATSDRLKGYTESLWKSVVGGSVSEAEATSRSRELQDAVFYRRRENPFVFDWLYRRHRRDYEEQMKVNTAAMVSEAQQLHAS